MLAVALKAIPSHRERPLSKHELVARICTSSQAPAAQVEAALEVALQMVSLFDLFQESSDGYFVLGGQTQTYCRNALVWFIEQNQPLVTNWGRSGTAREDVPLSNLLEQAPYLLKAIETRRKDLATRRSLPMVASREQPCSVVLFKAIHQGQSFFLHQWDQKAERYQLIGGKHQQNDETVERTAAREVEEELGSRVRLLGDQNFFLTKASIGTLEEFEVSRTYGALTQYRIDVFSARLELSAADFTISESDLWISTEEMLAGQTSTKAPIAPLGGRLVRDYGQYLKTLVPSMDFQPQLPISEVKTSSYHERGPSLKLTSPESVSLKDLLHFFYEMPATIVKKLIALVFVIISFTLWFLRR